MLPALALFFITAFAAQAQTASVLGNWREPSGSVIEVFKCGSDICMKLVAISPSAPARVDHHNPDAALRTRPLCGLQIGYGFHLTDPTHADDGKLYDPKTGKNYRGLMSAEGTQLHLRGYVGIKAFGRSETWARVDRSAATCHA